MSFTIKWKSFALRYTSAALCISLLTGMFGGLDLKADEGIPSEKETHSLSHEAWVPRDAEPAWRYEGDLSQSELATAVLSENDIPECIDPSLASEKQHVKRLYAQETDFYTVIFQNRDGSKTMYSFNEPVKFKDKAGVVRDKSNALKNATASSRYAEYRYENKANDIKTYFPQTLDEDKGVDAKIR